MPTQFDPQNPLTQYPRPPFPEQEQPGVGLAAEMDPKPDHGEESYVGLGRMAGHRTLITGADSGIGRAVAIAFAREGADVALSYLPEEHTDAQQVVALIEAAGRRAVTLPGDISEESFCAELVESAAGELGGLDSLVMVAAHQKNTASILDLTTEDFDTTFKTNVYSVLWLVKAAVPLLGPGATIVTTGSVQGTQPSPDKLDYASSKATIQNLTKGLAQQLAPRGIRVNCVAPGPVWTPLQPSSQPGDRVAEFGAQAPLGRPAQPAELAAAYVHFATQESSFTTGATLHIAGGSPI